MNWSSQLRQLPPQLKLLTLIFVLTLLFGYGAGFMVLLDQTGASPAGIEENYLGNEDNEEAEMIKFRKSKFEMLTTIHSHVFTLGMIFLVTGALTYFTGLPKRLKTFLMAEPPASLMVSFGSLLLMWLGLPWFNYLAYISGMLMHSTFVITLLLLIRELYFSKTATTA